MRIQHVGTPAWQLALTRYCFTSKLYCGNQSSFYAPPPPAKPTILQYLSRRWEHLHARALQIRAELSTHIHRETGPQRPIHSFWSFLFEKESVMHDHCAIYAPPHRPPLVMPYTIEHWWWQSRVKANLAGGKITQTS